MESIRAGGTAEVCLWATTSACGWAAIEGRHRGAAADGDAGDLFLFRDTEEGGCHGELSRRQGHRVVSPSGQCEKRRQNHAMEGRASAGRSKADVSPGREWKPLLCGPGHGSESGADED